MLPLLVTQVPTAIILAGAYLYAYTSRYPDAPVSQAVLVTDDSPAGLVAAMLFFGAVHSLFSFVGGAATIVSVRNTIEGKPISLSAALDPAFTRMGGLLLLGIVFNLLGGLTIVGLFVLVYLILRWGLAIHVYILEDAGPWAAATGSWRMLKGHMLRFTGTLLTAVPVILVLFLAFAFIVSLIAFPFGTNPGRDGSVGLNTLFLGASGLLAVPVGAYLATITTMYYLKLREPVRA